MEIINIYISAIAVSLSILAFCHALWLTYRNRPKLRMYFNNTTLYNSDSSIHAPTMMITVANVGYRAIILEKFVAIAKDSHYDAGHLDIHALLDKKYEQVLPKLVEPGAIFKFNAIKLEETINTKYTTHKNNHSLDKYLYFGFIDSFNRFHGINAEVVRHVLNIKLTNKKPNKFFDYIKRKIEYIKYKQRQKKVSY